MHLNSQSKQNQNVVECVRYNNNGNIVGNYKNGTKNKSQTQPNKKRTGALYSCMDKAKQDG